MNRRKRLVLFAGLLTVFLGVFMATNGWPLPLRPHGLDGVIVSVDVDKRQLTLLTLDDRQVTLTWNDQTRFWRGKTVLSAEDLRVAQRVHIYYRRTPGMYTVSELRVIGEVVHHGYVEQTHPAVH